MLTVEDDEKFKLKMQNKANFRKGRMKLSVYMKWDYEEFCGFGRRENKANRRLLAGNPKQDE